MAKGTRPEYHKALLEPSAYPAAKRRIKFAETPLSYFYKTGEFVYKIRKSSPLYSSLAIKEVYANSALTLGRRWAPQVYQDVVPVMRADGGYALAGTGEVVDYALRLTQLSEHYWLDYLLAHGKFSAAAAGRVARYLAQQHQLSPLPEQVGDLGRPEHFRALLEEVIYQVKKYVDVTLSQAMLDMVTRPLDRFLDESRKLFLRRQKKGRIVDGHGDFTPARIHIKGKEVFAVSPLDGLQKYRQLDAANDVATLSMELVRLGAEESAALFVQRYLVAARDRELLQILPAYKAFQAMRRGLGFSEPDEQSVSGETPQRERHELAHTYFNLAVRFAREIPR